MNMRPDNLNRERRFLSVHNSVNLPSNLLTSSYQPSPRTTARTTFRRKNADTADPYRYSATIDLANQTHFAAATADPRVRPKHSHEKQVMRQWIVEKQHNQKQESLAQRLRNLRVDNNALGDFSLSKLLSKIKVLKDTEEKDSEEEQLYNPVGKQIKSKKKVVKPQLFRFKDTLTHRSTTPSASYSLQIPSSRKGNQDQQSTKIFKKYFCPPNSYRDPAYFNQIEPDDKYIYRDGKKVQCKRIHNFYTSHMYKRGYSRHYKKIEDEDLMACTDGFHK